MEIALCADCISDLGKMRDEELVVLAREHGHAGAARELLLRNFVWSNRLIGWLARRRGLGPMDAEDAVQESVFGILRAIDRYRGICEPGMAPGCSFRSFLRRVLGDQFKDFVKRLWRIEGRHERSPWANRVLSGRVGEGEGATSCILTRAEEDPAELAERKELSAWVRQTIATLDVMQRRLGEGLLAGKGLREMAAELGISYDNAKRQRRKLRASLSAWRRR